VSQAIGKICQSPWWTCGRGAHASSRAEVAYGKRVQHAANLGSPELMKKQLFDLLRGRTRETPITEQLLFAASTSTLVTRGRCLVREKLLTSTGTAASNSLRMAHEVLIPLGHANRYCTKLKVAGTKAIRQQIAEALNQHLPGTHLFSGSFGPKHPAHPQSLCMLSGFVVLS
jgi:hypothetical protein